MLRGNPSEVCFSFLAEACQRRVPARAGFCAAPASHRPPVVTRSKHHTLPAHFRRGLGVRNRADSPKTLRNMLAAPPPGHSTLIFVPIHAEPPPWHTQDRGSSGHHEMPSHHNLRCFSVTLRFLMFSSQECNRATTNCTDSHLADLLLLMMLNAFLRHCEAEHEEPSQEDRLSIICTGGLFLSLGLLEEVHHPTNL